MNAPMAHTLPRSRLGERVRDLREARGMTLDALAKEAGVSRKTIVNVQSGKHSPSLEKLAQIAAALGVSVSDLVSDEATAA